MITLESAKIAFDTWRAAKANSNTPIPTELWNMVRDLLLRHRKADICRILRIGSHQIKRHCVTPPSSRNKESQPTLPSSSDFVEAIPASNAGMSELTLKGNSKSLHLCFPTSTLCDILPIVGRLL